MNNRRGLVILLVVFMALAGIVLLQPDMDDLVTRSSTSNTATPEPTPIFLRVFPNLTIEDIQAVRLQSPVTEQTFTLALAADGTWTAPQIEGRLDQEAARSIAQTAVLLIYTYTTPVPEGGDLEQFGFRPYGDFLILILTKDGREHVIAVGAPLQTGPDFYACIDDSCTDDTPEVYILQRSPIDYLVDFLQYPPLSP